MVKTEELSNVVKNYIIENNINYNILSLDGGGIRGLILLQQLVALEEELKQPLYKVFNLISGTSTGGIIAILLSLGYTAKQLLDFYVVYGEKIFKKRFLRFGWFRPKYKDKFFNEVINKYVGDKKLSNLLTDSIVVGYNISTMDKIIFKSRKAKVNSEYDYSLFDVIRSTAAAPSFFNAHKIKEQYFTDGGLVINNPSMVSYIEALNYDIKYNKINVLSYSTGTTEKPLNKKVIKGGQINWAVPIIDILLTEQSQTTDYFLESLFQLEKGIYLRCNSFIDKSSGKIDDVTKKNIDRMIADGQSSTLKNIVKIKEFCKFIS